MNWDFHNILFYPPITGTTILSVDLPPHFRVIAYLIAGIVLLLGTSFFFAKKYSLLNAFRKAIIIAFFSSALFYAIYTDIGWSTWLKTDIKKYWGLSTEEKSIKMYNGLYVFSMEAKKLIHDDYIIYSSYFQEPRLFQYYLLPLNKRSDNHYRLEKAPYIVVLKDTESQYDLAQRVFTRGEITIKNVELISMFAHDAYILKRL